MSKYLCQRCQQRPQAPMGDLLCYTCESRVDAEQRTRAAHKVIEDMAGRIAYCDAQDKADNLGPIPPPQPSTITMFTPIPLGKRKPYTRRVPIGAAP